MKISYKNIVTIMLGIVMSSMIVSCGDDDGDGEKKIDDSSNYNSNIGMKSENSDVMRLEVPKIRQGDNFYFRSHWAPASNYSSKTVMNYCYEYDASCYHTRWVAFSFDDITSQSNTSRSEAWSEDYNLPSSVRLPVAAYSYNFGAIPGGYQRGHLCASQDRVFSTEANKQTFYMSNMSPQEGNFNSNYWAELEQLIRHWAYSGKYRELYVCKGGTIREDQRLGVINTYNAKGSPAEVAIPKYYFMAILGETKAGTFQSIGFWLEHKDYGYSNNRYPDPRVMQKHVVSIDELEKLTGIDFFCNLNDKLENAVEKGCNVDAWGWK